MLKISFWHALLLQTWQKKQQARNILQAMLFKFKCRAQQLRLVELGKAIEKASWQLNLLLPMQAWELCALPDSNTCTPVPLSGLECCHACASCFVLIVTNWQSQAVCVQPIALFPVLSKRAAAAD